MGKKEELDLIKAEIRKDIEEEVRKEVEAKIKEEAETKGDSIPVNSERELAKMEKTMKQILAEEEKVSIFIPDDPINDSKVATVSVNGVQYAIPRGKEFKVPKSIKEVWERSYIETMKVNRRIKVQDVEKKDEVEVI